MKTETSHNSFAKFGAVNREIAGARHEVLEDFLKCESEERTGDNG